MKNKSLIYKIAFTLAETLIVMGIIGVVAALTLPNLNSSTGDKEKVAKVKKIYSNLNDAIGRAKAVYGPYEEWFQGNMSEDDIAKRVTDRLSEFMKYSKICTVSDSCSYLDANNKSYGEGTRVKYAIVLADGATVGVNIKSLNYGNLIVDIDGVNKGPNEECKDVFLFPLGSYTQGEILPTIDKNHVGDRPYDKCTAWVIEVGNMDYLKANDSDVCPDAKTKLDWTTNTTCK